MAETFLVWTGLVIVALALFKIAAALEEIAKALHGMTAKIESAKAIDAPPPSR
jgi:hypothetical protein